MQDSEDSPSTHTLVSARNATLFLSCDYIVWSERMRLSEKCNMKLMGISEEIIVETETKVKIDSKRNSITLLHIVWMFTCFLHSAHAAVLSENFSLVKWTRRSSIACCWRDRASVQLISSWNAWFTGCNAKSSDKLNDENSNWIIVMIHTIPNCEQIVGIKRKIPTRPQNSVYLNCRTRLNFLFFLSHWVEQHFFHFFTASHEIWIWYFFVKLWNVADRVIHFMWNPSTWAENECAVCFGFFFQLFNGFELHFNVSRLEMLRHRKTQDWWRVDEEKVLSNSTM